MSLSRENTSFRYGIDCFKAGVLLLVSLNTPCHGELTTTGTAHLQRFFDKVEHGTNAVTVLSFGDSMADSYRSIGFVIMNKLAARLGYAGYALNTYRNGAMWNLTNGASRQGPSEFWFSDSFKLIPGSGVWWEAQPGWPGHSPIGGGTQCDHIKLFYVSQPEGGNCILFISTNTGPWTAVASLNGYSPTPEGQYTNLNLPLNFYRLRVECQTGTNIIIGTQTQVAKTNGLHAAFTDYGGITLANVINVPLAIRAPIFRALSPDLLIWHMKEPLAPLPQWLTENEQWWADVIPDCSVIYVGTPYISADTNATTASTVAQNTIVRAFAIQYSRTYMDCMTPSVSYNWLSDNGFINDGTHLNLNGSAFLANIMWNELGLFALRVPRNIQAQRIQAGVRLTWPSTNGVFYELQSSSNHSTWTPIHSVPGDGSAKSYTNNITTDPQFFRLRLSGGN